MIWNEHALLFRCGLGARTFGTGRVGIPTPVNQFLELRLIDDPGLPAAVGEPIGYARDGSGVDDERGLAAIRQELSSDRAVSDDDQGVLHSHDLTGYGIAFKVASVVAPEERQRRMNTPTHIGRITTPGRPSTDARTRCA